MNLFLLQVLMNLLIALMASTYEAAVENTATSRLIDKYNLTRDTSYVCFSGKKKKEKMEMPAPVGS